MITFTQHFQPLAMSPINSVSTPIFHYMRPYTELARLEKPTGSLLMFWPFAWGLTMAAFHTHAPLKYYIQSLFQYLAAAVIIRSCICTVNDIVDRDIDASVSRTKKRPLPSGRISVRSALIFLFLQYSLGIVFFVTFLEGLALWTALFQFIPMGIVYPFLKRYTHWPQAWLGFLMNFGLVTAWISTTGFVHSALLVSLLLSCWCWTLYYDTIYACQDAKDDIKLGVHSTAILFGSWIRPLLVAFGVSFVSLLAICGHSNNQGWIFYIVSVGGTIGHLLWQSFTVNLDVPRSCWRTFTRNGHLGWIIWAGLALDYLRIM